MKRTTNAEYARGSKELQDICSLLDIPSTTRQASKYRRGLGLAYKSRGLLVLHKEIEGTKNEIAKIQSKSPDDEALPKLEERLTNARDRLDVLRHELRKDAGLES